MSGTFFKHGSLVEGTSSTVTAGGTLTLTNASDTNQQLTGTSAQTVQLPDATTMSIGRAFRILNRSTGTITVNYNSATLLTTVNGGQQRTLTLINNSTTDGIWDVTSVSSGGGGYNYTSQTTTYTAVVSDFVNCSGTFTVTLPTAVGNSGGKIGVKNSGTGTITINTTSAQTIDGLASGVIKLGTQYDDVVFISDGANWLIESNGIYIGSRITTTTAQAITSGSTNTIQFDTIDKDPQGAFNTGTYTFTAVFSGLYAITGALFFTGTGLTVAGRTNINMGGTYSIFLGRILVEALGQQVSGNFNGEVFLTAGDTVNISFGNVGTGGTITLSGSAVENWLSIVRVNN